MTDEIEMLDVVRLLEGLPEPGIPAGATATVIHVHGSPPTAYEIEVLDGSGNTLWWGPVKSNQIELAPDDGGLLGRADG